MCNRKFRRGVYLAHAAQFHIALLLQLLQSGRPRSGRAFQILQRWQCRQFRGLRLLHLMRRPRLLQCYRLHNSPNARNTSLQRTICSPRRCHRVWIHPRPSTVLFPVDLAPRNQKPRFPLPRNFHLVKLGNPRGIDVTTRTNGIQPHRTHHIPSTHLSAILIANQPIRTVFIKLLAHIVNDPLRLFRLPAIVIQIRHVVTGFVPVGILAYQPGNIGLIPARSAGICAKQRVQMFLCGIHSPQLIH